jgi:hypothetical protein
VPNEGGYSAGSIFLQVVPSFQGFEAAARRVAKGMEGVIEQGLDQGAEKGASKAEQHIKDALTSPDLNKTAKDAGKKTGEDFGGEFGAMLQKRVNAAMKSIGTEGGEQVAAIRKDLESLKDKKIGVDVDATKARATLADIGLRARILSSVSPDIAVRTNAGKVAAEMSALSREVQKLDGRQVKVKVDADTSKASAQLSAFNRLIGRTGSQAEDTANSFRAFNGVLLTTATIGPALIPVLVGIAGGLLALGPAAIAAGAGLVTLGIGFSGIGDAISALNDQQKNAAKDLQANSKRIAGAADGVADAQKRMKRAIEDGAESASDAAKRVKRAQADAAQANEAAARRVVDAQENAASRVQDALERQEDAEKSLADAQRASQKAVEDLREARAQAQKDLDDVAAKQRKNAVDERQGVLDLFDATNEFNATQQDPGATNYEKEQASINLENARIRLEDIRKEETELADTRKKGVNQSDRVKEAEERVKTAVEQQKEAQEDLLKAVGETNKTRIEGARAVSDAIREQQRTEADGAESVSDALQAQSRAAEDSAEAIADAQEALKRAQKDYANALYESNELGSASAQKLKEAMDALGPSGRAFALFIFGLKDEFQAIRDIIQAGLFPGLTEAIKLLVDTYLPSFTQFMGDLATVFGEIAKVTAQTLSNDSWKAFFAVFASVSPQLINNYSMIFLNLATVVAQLMTIVAPFAVKFSEALVELTGAAVEFMASAEGQKFWTDFFEIVSRVGPHVVKFISALVPAFVHLVEALVPVGTLALDALTAVLEWVAGLDPKVLQGIVVGILTMVVAFQLAAGATILLQAATAAFSTTIGLVVGIVVAVIGVLIYLYTTNETARKIIDGAMRGIAAVATWLFNNVLKPAFEYTAWAWSTLAAGFAWAWENVLKPVFSAVGAVARWLWEKILGPVFGFIWAAFKFMGNTMLWIWENITWPVFKVFARIAWELWELGLKVAFGLIAAGFKALADGFQWIWDHVLKPLFDLFMKYIGDDLVDTFETAVGWIKKHWDKIKDIAKAPVKFVLETVMNNGLIKGFNFLADKLGMDKVTPIPLDGFANGGIPYGVRPGYTPGVDTHVIAVGGGEAILRPELTRALGRDWVYEANARAKRGGVAGAMSFLGGFANGGIAWPVNGASIGTPFGKKGPMWSSGYHTGTDFPARVGTPIHSVTPGRVASAAWSSWGGNLMKINVPGLGTLLYAHQSAFAKREGDQVASGDTIGYVGATGNVTGPHLHLELRVGNTPIDPMRLFSGQAIVPGQGEEPEEPSRIDKILGGLKSAASWVKDAVSNPLNWLKSKVEGPLGDMKEKFGDSWLVKGLTGIPEKFFGSLVDKIKGLVGAGGDSGSGDMSQFTGTTSQLQKLVQGMAMSNYGWAGNQWAALNWLVQHESGWNPNAQNPTSTAYGLFQFLDGTWKGHGPKTSNPALQAQYGLEYIKERYGSPEQAKAFWEGHHWYADGGIVGEGNGASIGSLPDNGTMMYDNGGYLPPGITQVVNLTGKPEPVFTSDQFSRMGGTGSGFTYAPTFNESDLTSAEVAQDLMFTIRRLDQGVLK